MRQAEADDEKKEELEEKETYADFLTKEVSFNNQLLTVLRSLQGVNESLNKAEECASEKRIIDGLHMLEGGSARVGREETWTDCYSCME